MTLENRELHEVIKLKDYDSLKANTVGVTVDLSTTTYDNKYTAECDGYVWFESSLNGTGMVYLSDANGKPFGQIGSNVSPEIDQEHNLTLFVKKGTQMYATLNGYASAKFSGFQ